MRSDICKTIFPPFWKGVRKSNENVSQKIAPAIFDTETYFGIVYATGFFDGKRLQILHGDRKDHLDWFLDRLEEMADSHDSPVVAAHFLIFDLSVLFWKVINPTGFRPTRAPKSSHFSILSHHCTVEIYWSRPTFATIRFDSGSIKLVDTFAFYGMGLSRALKAIDSPQKKLPKPHNLGKRLIPLKELHPYLAGDCKGAFALLEDIIKRHLEFNVRMCVSAPMLAGKIFRRHFMRKDFVRPSGKLMSAALLSYHGGKNSFVARPGWHKRCWDLDINSAYAEAMFRLPDFCNGKWVRGRGIDFLNRHSHGIFQVSGLLKNCKWGVLFTHDFKRLSGVVEKVWATGYEIREALLSGELSISEVHGYGWRANKKTTISPFRQYVEHWYAIKRTTENKAFREFAKHMLTDLYGKFIARIDDGEGNLTAGSMFDPSIASLITGYVRARIHRLEHKYNALHTATDGFITQKCPDPSDIGGDLGFLKQETYGPVLILRNKLYLHYDTSGKLKKTGLHGFELGPKKLLTLWKSADRTYRVERLVKWAEAWHIGLPPGGPKTVKKELHI